MKEMLTNQTPAGYSNSFVNVNNRDAGSSSITNDNSSRRYAMFSTDWISAIGEEQGMHPLPDPLLRRLAEDASYRLREVLHKCVTRLRHSKRKRLTAVDVNAVITNLCDGDPVLGAPESMAEYHAEAKVYVPNESFINLFHHMNDSLNLSQTNVPYLQETEICDMKLTEARHNYAKRVLKTLFNGSQNTFQVLINDCATNPQLGDEGVIDKLMSIARSLLISSNAQYTRISTRTCQLIIAIASNSEAIYPYHLISVDKVTELLLELLLGQSFVSPNLEVLFKVCALKLMLRWPSIADRYIPMLESVLLKDDNTIDIWKKRTMVVELLASIQPLIFFENEVKHVLSIQNVLRYYASPASAIWQQIALAICALVRSQKHLLKYTLLMEHYGDSLLPYLPAYNGKTEEKTSRKIVALPLIMKSKMKYINIIIWRETYEKQRKQEQQKRKNKQQQEQQKKKNNTTSLERKIMFPDSTLKGSRREIRFAFAGGLPVPPSNLRRVSLRADYHIPRNDPKATFALVASHRLFMIKDKAKRSYDFYNLAHVCL